MELTDSAELQQRIREESKKYLSREPQAGEFTRMDFMELNQIGRSEARKALAEMEASGVIYKRDGKRNGSFCNVYGFTDQEQP